VATGRFHDDQHLGYTACSPQPPHRRLDLSLVLPHPHVFDGTPICVDRLSVGTSRRDAALIKHYFGHVRATDVRLVRLLWFSVSGRWDIGYPLLIFTTIRISIEITLSVNMISPCIEIGLRGTMLH